MFSNYQKIHSRFKGSISNLLINSIFVKRFAFSMCLHISKVYYRCKVNILMYKTRHKSRIALNKFIMLFLLHYLLNMSNLLLAWNIYVRFDKILYICHNICKCASRKTTQCIPCYGASKLLHLKWPLSSCMKIPQEIPIQPVSEGF